MGFSRDRVSLENIRINGTINSFAEGYEQNNSSATKLYFVFQTSPQLLKFQGLVLRNNT